MTDEDELEQRVSRLEDELEEVKRRLPDTDRGDTATDPSPSTTHDPAPDTTRSKPRSTPTRNPPSTQSLTERIEDRLSVTWLGVIGVVALLFATVFAIRLAIQEGMIGPLGRVVLGLVTGLVFSVGGGYAATHTAHERWGWTVAGGGVAIAYFSLYASYALDSYRAALGTPIELVIGGLTIITAAAVIVSVRERQYVLCAEAFLLSFVTAFFTQTVGYEALAYAGVLTLGILAVIHYRGWLSLAIGGVLGSYLLFVAAFSPEDPHLLLDGAYLGGIFVAYLYAAANPIGRSEIAEGLTALNVFLGAFLLVSRVEVEFPTEYGAVPLLGVAALLGGLLFLAERPRPLPHPFPVRRLQIAPVALALVLLAAIGLNSSFGMTLAAAVLIPAAAALGGITEKREYTATAHALVPVALGKLLADYPQFGAFESVTEPSVTHGIALLAAMSYLTYWVLAEWHGSESGSTAPYAYLWIGSSLIALLSIIELSGYALTGAWAVLALVLLVFGLLYEKRVTRLQGLGFFGLTTLKVFLVDTQGLDPIPRILSLVILGVVLIAAAFAYSHFSNRLLETERTP